LIFFIQEQKVFPAGIRDAYQPRSVHTQCPSDYGRQLELDSSAFGSQT
jgi:hypothetical protein